MSWSCYCIEAIAASLDGAEDFGRRGTESTCPHCECDRRDATPLEDARLRLTQLPAALPIRHIVEGAEEFAEGDFYQSCPECRGMLLTFDGFPEIGSEQCWSIPLRCRGCSHRFRFLIIACPDDTLVYRWVDGRGD